ncbi:molybdenum cofactor guanylyltransferase [Poriferisphaera sp. WC338]|uniref:molybdenum cofactor guanylyltransferase n=1 Tax=Poriferisphaera sp. WC338 TaxID=3425129 RepID=UPI003D8190CD
MSEQGKLPLYILAGGRSSRFGSDKARMVIEGKPILKVIEEVLKPYCLSTTVIAEEKGKYEDLGLRTIADDKDGYCGPLMGVLTAANDMKRVHGSGWFMLVSCDVVGMDHRWIKRLVEGRLKEGGAVVFYDDRYQPFPGLYHSVGAACAEEMLRDGRSSMQQFLAEIDAVKVDVPHDWGLMIQVNTPEDYQRIQRKK